MSLFFDTSVKFRETGAITTNGVWHPTQPLLAVASYSQERGGFVTIFDDVGEPLQDVETPWHPVAQVTSLAWRPDKSLLAAGWEDGALRIWDGSASTFASVSAPHSSQVNILAFSEKGGRLVSSDSSGSLVGWKVDSRNQLYTAFHHDLKESISHVTFRLTVPNKSQKEMHNLAKAAVNGDEQALDMFSNWRPRTAANRVNVHANTNDNHCFYVGTQSGVVYYINHSGTCTEVLNTDGQPLISIMYHPTKDSIIIMMEGLNIGHFSVDTNGNLTELVKVKLSGKSQAFRGANSQGLVWAGPGLLAILTGDMTIRVWDIDNSDNYVLSTLSEQSQSEDNTETAIFTCISYCKLNNILCAGTNLGQIYFWFRNTELQDKFMDNPESAWQLKNINRISGTIKQLFWGNLNLITPLLAVNCITKVYILKEQTLNAAYSDEIWATQVNACEIVFHNDDSNEGTSLKTDIQITCLAICEDYLVISNSKTVAVYEIIWSNTSTLDGQNNIQSKKTSQTKLLNTFLCENELLVTYDKKIIFLTTFGIQIRTLNGLPCSTINSSLQEGEPIGIDLNQSFLTIYTINGYIKLCDLKKCGNAKTLNTITKDVHEWCDDFGEIIWAKTNCTGTKVAFAVANSNLLPDQKIYFWDSEHNLLEVFEHFLDRIHDDEEMNQRINQEACRNRLPLCFCWDTCDERLFICNAKKVRASKNTNSDENFTNGFYGVNPPNPEKTLSTADNVLVSLFVTLEHQIVIKEVQELDSDGQLIGLASPYIVILLNGVIKRLILSDFHGMEKHDSGTKSALLNFSYHLSLGNMDAAIQSIRHLPSGSNAWRNLAKVCVKTKRIDVAKICLGHMGAAREARALRMAMEDKNLERDAVVAVLAIQLGMVNDAELLYKQCNRYDLLNKLYQARNKYPEAVSIAKANDRIHLKSTAFNWGRYSEMVDDIPAAIKHYEESGTHRDNVPRMLLDKPKELEEYIKKSNDKELMKWWGQYLESIGDMNRALQSYETAGDYFSQVRVLCFSQQVDRASHLALVSGDKAAAYHMARYYETNDDIEKAITFFIKAQAYSNAVRLCKEHNIIEELWNVAALASKRDKTECARYYETIGDFDRAIVLYHQSGMIHKALDLAFKTKKYETLQTIASDLDMNSDPALVKKCADYFVENKHYEKAVDLLALGKQYLEALDICLQHNVQVTETLADRLTPEKEEMPDEATRVSILEKLAESLQQQGNYHLATKKFTQAGNKIRAMKSLLKSGDTEKIVFFTNISRQKEIYIMAANYLQSLDWQNNPSILRNIIHFYSKGRALDLLANFYVACAQVEIDEFQNYEKALGALTEASRALSKVTAPLDMDRHRRATDIVNGQMTAIKKFVDCRRLLDRGDVTGGIAQCNQLLKSADPSVQKYIRKGDIYAVMIQNLLSSGNITDLNQTFTEMRQYLESSGNVGLTYYLSGDVIQQLSKALGVPLSMLLPQKNTSTAEETTEEAEQEIQEEVEDS